MYMKKQQLEEGMKDTKYNSSTGKPVVRTTSNGGRYVRPSDIVRSSSGRAIIRSHASAAGSSATKSSEVSADLNPKK